jgi:hypothetical protein
MDLLDFNYWTLNESQKKYYTFEIPIRMYSDMLNKEYHRVLDETLSTFTKDIVADVEALKESILINIKPRADELVSAIYGEVEEPIITFSLYYPGRADYGSIPPATMLFDSIKRKTYPNISTKTDDKHKIIDKYEIMVICEPDKINNYIHEVALDLSHTLTGYRYSNDKTLPTPPDELEYFKTSQLSKDLQKDAISKLSEKLDKYLKYTAYVRIMNKLLVSEVTPNIEQIASDLNTKVAKIKSFDFNNISDSERKSQLDEILKFQNSLLIKANPLRIEVDETTDALIETFRILIKEVGNVKTIKKELLATKS